MEKENIMRNFKIVKVVLSAGASGTELDKSAKLLEKITKRKAEITKSGPNARIPAFNVKPMMPLGARITLRGKKAIEILKQMLAGADNTLKKRQASENQISFGIKEYIDVPGLEYSRDIGIRGFNVTIVIERAGLRVRRKKIKQGKVPKRQDITRKEIINYMEENFGTKFI